MITAALAAAIAFSHSASAIPAFARQTGQPCASCHTAFPELTPFGRAFKLGGYTLGGKRCGDAAVAGSTKDDTEKKHFGEDLPFAVMVVPSLTHTKKDLDSKPDGFESNDNLVVQQTSIFFGGQIYCNSGAFIQATYDGSARVFGLDNADIRYTGNLDVGGVDVLFGFTGNNNPTVQDVWNSAPAWSFPFMSGPDSFAPGPSAGTMLEGGLSQRVAGAGAYAWINNSVYAEFSAYSSLDRNALKAVGQDPSDGTPTVDGIAPYWRVAVERSWDNNSLMFGTMGMRANLSPTAYPIDPGTTDKVTDLGLDGQYQWIGDIHIFTARASCIWEHQKLDASFPAAQSSKSAQDLYSFRASGTYIYDHMFSFTAGYFNLRGTTDSTWNNWSSAGSPNSSGWTTDVAYLPFMNGGPDIWPWFNARIGISYTHYDKFDGADKNFDGNGRNAKDNDTAFVYTWFVF